MKDGVSAGRDHIEVRGLWKIYGSTGGAILRSDNRIATKRAILEKTGCVLALRNVSFSVQKGEVFVLMGLSGSGKSTLIRCLIRLVEPDAGDIFINRTNICNYNASQLIHMRRTVTGMIFQQFGLLPHRSVLHNVSFGLKMRGIAKEERYAKARQVIEMVGLRGWENRLPKDLSGGMQQRVGVARALANDPEILLMDEPFSGLDPLIRRQMQNEFLTLQSEIHKTIVFVTHDLNEALKMGDHIAIMKDGEIIQVGLPIEVVTDPIDSYVYEFVRDVAPSKVLQAENIMEEPTIVLRIGQQPESALEVLKGSVNSAFVLDDRNSPVGITCANSIKRIVNHKCSSIDKAVDPNIALCAKDTLLEDLFGLASSTSYPIAVIDTHNKFVGAIPIARLLSCVCRKEIGQSAKGVPS